MKKAIVVLVFVMLNLFQHLNLKAQATWNFNHTTWLVSTTEMTNSSWFTYLTLDSLNPDTTINFVTYKKIKDGYGQYILGIRSDNHKLYGIGLSQAAFPFHEYLMYDFSANVGDTIYNVAASDLSFNVMDTVKAYITAKDSFLLSNRYYSVLKVNLISSTGGWFINSIWYENIGCNMGLIEVIPFESLTKLECYSNNDTTIDISHLPTQWNFTTDTVPASPGNPCFAIPFNNGINEHTNAADISVYPNPATTKLNIESTSAKLSKIKIMNVMGQCIYQSEIKNPKAEINLTNMAKGIYFVRVENEKQEVENRKIVVE